MKIKTFFMFALLCLLEACALPVTGTSSNPLPSEDSDMHPNTRSTLAMKDGWSSSGKLTRVPPGGMGQQVTLQADFPESDVYTVQFSVSPPAGTPDGTDGYYRAIATVQWTVEGNTITRMIDVGNGTSISAPSQAVRVSVVDATTNIKGPPFLSVVQYGITISVTRGVRAFGTVPPILYGESIGIAASPGKAIILIPQNAGVASVEITAIDFTNPGTNPIVEVRHESLFNLFKVYTQNQFDNGFVSVAPSATQIEINNLTSDLITVSITWGIDG